MKYAVVALIAAVVIVLSVISVMMSARTQDKYGALYEETGIGGPFSYALGVFFLVIMISFVAGVSSHTVLYGASSDFSESLGMSALFIVIAVIASAVSYRRFYG